MAGYNPQIIRSMSGQIELNNECLEADSMSFVAGEFVYLNAGAVTNVATDGAAIYGIAKKSATNVTSGNIIIPIEVIYPGDIIEMSTRTTATDYSAALFVVGVNYGLIVASNVHYADFADTSNDRFTCVGYKETMNGGTSYRGHFTVIASVLQSSVGA